MCNLLGYLPKHLKSNKKDTEKDKFDDDKQQM